MTHAGAVAGIALWLPLVAACARGELVRTVPDRDDATAPRVAVAAPRSPTLPVATPPRGASGTTNAAPAAGSTTGPSVRGVRVTRVTAARGEDGAGHLVSAVHPVAIDVIADAWVGRALDPALVIGGLVFHQYEHPALDTLRFVVADDGVLPRGPSDIAVQYGDDAASRVVVARALAVPP